MRNFGEVIAVRPCMKTKTLPFQLKALLLPLFTLLLSTSTVKASAESCKLSVATGRAQGTTRLEDRELTLMAWNLNNVFERRMELTGKDIPLGDRGKKKTEMKPEHEIRRIRDEIAEHMPDFGIFTEIENVAAMRKLLELDPRLKGKYHVFLKNGNDERGIDICLVVKKELGLKFKFDTHKDMTWVDQGQTGPLFSRDLPALRIYQPGDEQPSLILMGNHAKSQRDREGDPNSSRWRTAQYQGIGEISDQYANTYQDVGQILGGDFNINVIRSKEIAAIRDKLKSAYDLVPENKKIPENKRITHWFFPIGGQPVKQQLDDVRARGPIEILDAQIHDLKNKNNQAVEEGPNSFKEREGLASDHAPLFIRFRIKSRK